jgi:hypothetical protein
MIENLFAALRHAALVTGTKHYLDNDAEAISRAEFDTPHGRLGAFGAPCLDGYEPVSETWPG